MGVERSTNPEGKCPKCHGRMIKHFSTISGNAKYITWQCDECEYQELKCIGLIQ